MTCVLNHGAPAHPTGYSRHAVVRQTKTCRKDCRSVSAAVIACASSSNSPKNAESLPDMAA